MNMRDRIASVDKNDAGNYWRPQELLKEDFNSPMAVRHIVKIASNASRISDEDTRRPGLKQASRVGVVTNWTGFYRDLSVPGCTQLLHMPLMRSEQVAQSYFVIFRPG